MGSFHSHCSEPHKLGSGAPVNKPGTLPLLSVKAVGGSAGEGARASAFNVGWLANGSGLAYGAAAGAKPGSNAGASCGCGKGVPSLCVYNTHSSCMGYI